VPDEKTKEKYQIQFSKAVREIEEFNARPGNSYKQTVNQFTHLSMNEVSGSMLGLSLLQTYYPEKEKFVERLFDPNCQPKPIDWRSVKGAVTPVYVLSQLVSNKYNHNCISERTKATVEIASCLQLLESSKASRL
jgi:hypothetical protein